MKNSNESVLNFEDIHQLNEALLIMRHFIKTSARLLPFLSRLREKKYPTSSDMVSMVKIIEVYENCHFDTNSSRILLNSNILDLIKASFDLLSKNYSSKNHDNRALRHFLREYHRLLQKWNEVDAN